MSDKTIIINNTDAISILCKSCLVCDEAIELTKEEEIRIKHGLSINPGICDKCKNAILRMRRFMEGN